MTPLEAMELFERTTPPEVRRIELMGRICEGYRAALAEIEELKRARDEAWRVTEELYHEADRLAGLLFKYEKARIGCPFCTYTRHGHADNCPAFTPDGEVKRAP